MYGLIQMPHHHHTKNGEAVTSEISEGGRAGAPSPCYRCPPFLKTHCHLATAQRNLQHTSKASKRCFLKKPIQTQVPCPSEKRQAVIAGCGNARCRPRPGRGGRKARMAWGRRLPALRVSGRGTALCLTCQQTDRA